MQVLIQSKLFFSQMIPNSNKGRLHTKFKENHTSKMWVCRLYTLVANVYCKKYRIAQNFDGGKFWRILNVVIFDGLKFDGFCGHTAPRWFNWAAAFVFCKEGNHQSCRCHRSVSFPKCVDTTYTKICGMQRKILEKNSDVKGNLETGMTHTQ